MILLLIAASYLLGALPIGLYVGKLVRGIDVREFGSGNIGASNVWRTLGPRWGVLVFLLDVCKGLVPVLASRHIPLAPAWLPVVCGLMAIAGHTVSPFLGFKGGKGVATSLGAAFGLSWMAGLCGFAAWGLCLALTRTISVSSAVGTAVGSFLIWQWNGRQWPYGAFAVLSTLFVVLKHRPNWARVKAGTEPKVGRK